ncbi:hypothetical protein FRC09_011283 [Ceratobasidium sp. 395]|nr:hypothetical protein FRC09_011283 [Ceratobasidium sp. 395]
MLIIFIRALLGVTRSEDQVTARWMKAHPRARDPVVERALLDLRPASTPRTRVAEGESGAGENGSGGTEDGVTPLEDDPRADPRHSSVATFRHRYECNTASHWPTRYRPPRANLTLEQSVEALVEGSGMSMIAPGADAQKVSEARESWDEKYRNGQVGGSVVVHYMKKREWWLECVEIMLGSKGLGSRPDGGGGSSSSGGARTGD